MPEMKGRQYFAAITLQRQRSMGRWIAVPVVVAVRPDVHGAFGALEHFPLHGKCVLPLSVEQRKRIALGALFVRVELTVYPTLKDSVRLHSHGGSRPGAGRK